MAQVKIRTMDLLSAIQSCVGLEIHSLPVSFKFYLGETYVLVHVEALTSLMDVRRQALQSLFERARESIPARKMLRNNMNAHPQWPSASGLCDGFAQTGRRCRSYPSRFSPVHKCWTHMSTAEQKAAMAAENQWFQDHPNWLNELLAADLGPFD